MKQIEKLENTTNENCVRTSTSLDAVRFDELANIYGGKNDSAKSEEQENLAGLGSGGFLCWC